MLSVYSLPPTIQQNKPSLGWYFINFIPIYHTATISTIFLFFSLLLLYLLLQRIQHIWTQRNSIPLSCWISKNWPEWLRWGTFFTILLLFSSTLSHSQWKYLSIFHLFCSFPSRIKELLQLCVWIPYCCCFLFIWVSLYGCKYEPTEDTKKLQ